MKKKAQMTLDLFLNLKCKNKQFFYIDWNDVVKKKKKWKLIIQYILKL